MSMNPIEAGICTALENYFHDLSGLATPHDLYAMVVQSAEKPLLEMVMQRTNHNQSIAAQWLGINRNTLRRKVQDHGLLGG